MRSPAASVAAREPTACLRAIRPESAEPARPAVGALVDDPLTPAHADRATGGEGRATALPGRRGRQLTDSVPRVPAAACSGAASALDVGWPWSPFPSRRVSKLPLCAPGHSEGAERTRTAIARRLARLIERYAESPAEPPPIFDESSSSEKQKGAQLNFRLFIPQGDHGIHSRC